jgi:hypothetical protein
MDKILKQVGNGAAALGLIVCLVAGLSRLLGSFHLLGFQSVTLFIGGMALMVFANMTMLYRLSARL